MSTRTVPRDTWASFFESFTRQHHGWLVTVDTGADRVAEEEPLEEVHANGDDIEIRAGSFYRVPNVTIVTVTTATNDDTAVDHLEIESGAEKVTIRFRAAINPELVDGAP
ncbi:MAG TPA: DUF5335 family protein [Thermoanaerobaculia bacterium]|nr:DUF5335 family protein [Thermoanaerobaculia bacterium]